MSKPRTLAGSTGAVRVVAFTPDGKYLIANKGWGEATLLDFTSFKVLCRFSLERGNINSVTISPAGQHVAVAARGRPVRVWNLQRVIEKLERR